MKKTITPKLANPMTAQMDSALAWGSNVTMLAIAQAVAIYAKKHATRLHVVLTLFI